jgi:hypothetical protein
MARECNFDQLKNAESRSAATSEIDCKRHDVLRVQLAFLRLLVDRSADRIRNQIPREIRAPPNDTRFTSTPAMQALTNVDQMISSALPDEVSDT